MCRLVVAVCQHVPTMVAKTQRKACGRLQARCLANGGEEPGTPAHERVLEIIGARVRFSLLYKLQRTARPGTVLAHLHKVAAPTWPGARRGCGVLAVLAHAPPAPARSSS